LQQKDAMSPDELKDEIRRRWASVKTGASTSSALYPGGPDGSWMSVSLHERHRLPSWLYFRVAGGRIELARVETLGSVELLQWSPVAPAELDAVLHQFAADFEGLNGRRPEKQS
jgi:hypothetical protein